jgi:hypothetical protein
MRIRRIRQITLAVRDLGAARATFERLLDEPSTDPFEIATLGVRASELRFGGALLQLAAPLGADHPLSRFLQRRGEGIYNIAVEVDDLDAAVAELAEAGTRVSEPVEIEPGVRAAFVAMAAAHGMSLQLLEAAAAGQYERTRTIVDAPQAEHVAAAAASDDAAPAPPLDLSPDEWSDVD